MNIYEQIVETYPELADDSNPFFDGTIGIRDDSYGLGAYIEYWNYHQPLPDGLKIGKE